MSDQNQVVVAVSSKGPMHLGVLLSGVMSQLPVPERKKVCELLKNLEIRQFFNQLYVASQNYLSQMAAIEDLDSQAMERVRASVVGVQTLLLTLNQLGYEYERDGDTHQFLNPQRPDAANPSMN